MRVTAAVGEVCRDGRARRVLGRRFQLVPVQGVVALVIASE